MASINSTICVAVLSFCVIQISLTNAKFLGAETIFRLKTSITSNDSMIPSTPNMKRPTIKLIHRDSLLSPYDSSKTCSDSAKRSRESSISRFVYLSKIASKARDIKADLIPSIRSFLFYVSFSIGEPPVPQLTVMDTGSSLLWIKCLPCTPCSQNSGSIYNPYKSSTYSTLSCKDFYYCKYCNSFNQCLYNITYVEGPSSSGILSTERLTFEAPDDGNFFLSDVVFGCGHKTQNFIDEHFKGVFGLGNRAKASLLKQMGSKFSYCIGDVRDPYYNFNHLIIGDSARLEGFSTPVKIINGLYYLTLVGISVGGNMLDINASTFQKTPGVNNGVIIDSGTELTFLAKKGFEIIIKEIHLLSEGLLTRDEESSQELCYKGIVTQVAQGFPVLTFHFADGADLILDIMSMFIQVNPNAFCLGIAPSDGITSSGSLSIIGMLAQQYYNVGYDLNASKMYFQRIDCELLED